MDEKRNVQDLAEFLMNKHGISRKEAEMFVKEFFLLIEESLAKDKYAKIKGLGTFRLIDVESRESINVNTGERFKIQEHTKISFTPDSTIKEVVNKPFAHFEAVILNEDVQMDECDDAGEQPEVSLPMDKTANPNTSLENEPEEASQPETTEERPQEKQEKTKRRFSSEALSFAVIVAFVLILCSGLMLYMCYPDLFEYHSKESLYTHQEESPVAQLADTLPQIEYNLPADSMEEAEKTKEKEKEEVATVPKQEMHISRQDTTNIRRIDEPFQADSVSYRIVGTLQEYRIKEGETLTKVSLRFYGTKALWPYLVKHNSQTIQNPHNIHPGTTIQIPQLEKK